MWYTLVFNCLHGSLQNQLRLYSYSAAQADLDYFEPFAIMPIKFFQKKKSFSLFSGRGIITPKVFRGNLDRAGYSVTFHNQLSQIIFKVDKRFPRIMFI